MPSGRTRIAGVGSGHISVDPVRAPQHCSSHGSASLPTLQSKTALRALAYRIDLCETKAPPMGIATPGRVEWLRGSDLGCLRHPEPIVYHPYSHVVAIR